MLLTQSRPSGAREPAAACLPLQLGRPCSHGEDKAVWFLHLRQWVAWQQAELPLVLGRRGVRLSFEALWRQGA